MPDRVETSILTITSLRKALTVFGLIFIRFAICLLVRPSTSRVTVSSSRAGRSNCPNASFHSRTEMQWRSRSTAIFNVSSSALLQSKRNARHMYFRRPDMYSLTKSTLPFVLGLRSFVLILSLRKRIGFWTRSHLVGYANIWRASELNATGRSSSLTKMNPGDVTSVITGIILQLNQRKSDNRGPDSAEEI